MDEDDQEIPYAPPPLKGGGAAGRMEPILKGDGGGGADPEVARALVYARNARAGLDRAIVDAIGALQNESCSRVFLGTDGRPLVDPTRGGTLDASQILKDLQQANQGKNGTYVSVGFAVLEGGSMADVSGDGLRVSLQGPYYEKAKMTFDIMYMQAGNAQLQAGTVLHELGHVMNLLAPGFGSQTQILNFDGWSDAREAANNKLITDQCTDPFFNGKK